MADPTWVQDLLPNAVVFKRTLSASSVAVSVGDWVCTVASDTTGQTVTKATAAALATGVLVGIVSVAALPGASVSGIIMGTVPATVTGLGAGLVSVCRLNTTTARTERVGGLAPGEYGVGNCDAGGNLVIGITGTATFGAVYVTHTSAGAAYETVTSLTYTVPENTYVDVTFRATGKAAAEYAHYERVARYTRLTGGAVVTDWDVPISGSPKEVDVAWDAKINVSTNDLQFQVKANSDNPAWKLERILVPQTLP